MSSATIQVAKTACRKCLQRGSFRCSTASAQRAAATSATQQAVVQATNISVRQPPSLQNKQPTLDYSQIDRILFSSLSTGELQSLDMKMLHEIEQQQHDASSEYDMKALHELAIQKPTPLSLADMYKYASAATGADCWTQRIRNAQFLHRELKIRMAQRAVDLLTLPHGLNEATPIRNVAHVYLRYLKKFEACPSPNTPEEEQRFTDMLQSMVLDRTSIPMAIARGVAAWQDDRREHLEFERMQEMEEALYRFFTARVGLRFLTEHHILSSPNLNLASRQKHAVVQGRSIKKQETHDYIGCIQKNCDPVYELEQVVSEVTRQTLDCYGVCPKIQVVDCSTSDVEFTYVPHHLHYMLAELMKNSCRATVKRYFEKELQGVNGERDEMLPPIRVVVVKGEEDVTIKIADKGGGIPRSSMSQIWKFAHSTANKEEATTDFGKDEVTGGRIRGFGLPLARVYARYFGGELTLKSMEGYGVDAYLYLPRLGDECENLPPRVTASPGNLESLPTSPAASSSRRRLFSTRSEPSNDLFANGARGLPDDEVLRARRTRRILEELRSRAL